ncbi:IclR family transcriptional regulator [Sulfitobacter donghicola]|uniref:Transcriptional regulator n=1 Tax=Sulfitobacter donghicola DSW-25 = KCTC 12864 = JCM 14565 TaxID=1300350 RepID=A0A073IHM3_9RHOB|nr:IclR family transcriptional regulator [Sulfitobacter donghicola]KEJ89020.1 transcriptional regulator [Sulfitobacter donghicola DSW-25 = KCTC 12864 = JCM 14565]KIN67419.1 Transcriptional regulator [Sulfitobacter donghicola DSW-25 = KCTC 12864 = JCM 14565]
MIDAAPKEPKVDSTLSKGLLILENLAGSQNGKGVTELSKELGLTKSNTFRLLQTLTTLGYVQHRPDKSYAATLKTWRVGRASVENLNLRELAAPELLHLSQETGEAVYLAVRENLNVIYIDKIDSQKPIRSWNAIGGSAPLHCVGTGKAILAADFNKLRDQVSGVLTHHTEKTLTDLASLDADISATLARGYAFDTGEFRDRILSFGAAITLPGGEPVGALGISVPDINLPEGGVDQYGGLVSLAARSVSAKLGRG